MPERVSASRSPSTPTLLRGEDENEISLLCSMIEGLVWILYSPKQNPPASPTCILGKHPNPRESPGRFCASVYSMGKGGNKQLDVGPHLGSTRKDALLKLLDDVECEVGRMQLKDSKAKKGHEQN